jgi:hypothetical protein
VESSNGAEREPLAGLLAGIQCSAASMLSLYLASVVFPPHPLPTPQAFLSMAESATTLTSTFAPYDQYEVVIPMEKAGSCLQEMGAEVYGPGKLWDGFRTPALVRFVT